MSKKKENILLWQKINFNDLPIEIIEKILILVNDFSIINVCVKWKKIIEYNSPKIDGYIFNLLNDNPSIFEKIKIQYLTLFFSQIYDIPATYNSKYQNGFNDKIKIIYDYCPSLNNIILKLDLGYLVSDQKLCSKKIKLSDDFLNSYGNSTVSLLFCNYHLCFDLMNRIVYQKYTHNGFVKNIYIEIKDYSEQFDDEDEEILKFIDFYSEHYRFDRFINNHYINYYKFSFTGPNGFYIIYNRKDEKLFIRLPNLKKYQFYKKNYYRFIEVLPNISINHIYNRLDKELITYKIICFCTDIFQDHLFSFCTSLNNIEKVTYYCFENKPENFQNKINNSKFEFIHLDESEEKNYNFLNMYSKIQN